MGPSGRGMPRSAPGNSPSNEGSLGDSDDDFVPSSNSEPGMEADNGSAAGEAGGTSQPSGPPLETEQGPRLPHAGFQRPIYQLPHDYPQLLERMACTALRELCFYYLAQHLHLRYPDRRSSQARYLAQRRARGHQDLGDVYSRKSIASCCRKTWRGGSVEPPMRVIQPRSFSGIPRSRRPARAR